MKCWELHTNLARSIGDPIIKPNGELYGMADGFANIPLSDGVRYTKEIRDTYLTKAMLSIQLDVLKSSISLPRYHIARILQRVFTQMGQTYTTDININGQPDDQLFIYTVLLYTKHTFPYNEGSPMFIDPIKAPAVTTADPEWNIRNLNILGEAQMAHYIGSKTNIEPELVAYTTTRAGVEYFGLAGMEIEHLRALSLVKPFPDIVKLEISYLKRSPDVSTFNPDEDIPFEANFLPHALNKAIMYAHLDSGELGAAYQAVPFLDQVNIGIKQDGDT